MSEKGTGFEIKNIPTDRWEDFRRLRLEALRSDPLAFSHSHGEEIGLEEAEWRRKIRNVLFALSKGRLVGMIGYSFGATAKTRHVAELDSFYVSIDCRGRGVGERLFRGALSMIRRNRDIIKVKLVVNSEQKAAIKLYEKEGFGVVGRLKKEAKVGNRFYDKLIMEKLL